MTGSLASARTIASGSPVSSSASRSASSPRGGDGSRTSPPPTVVSVLSTTRSPRAATTGEREPQLCVAAFAHESCRHVARPEVSRHRGRDRLELLERDVEPLADREVARLDEDVAALQP